MGLSIYIWIPSTVVGWKYCLRRPKSFFRSTSDRTVEREMIEGMKVATEYAWRCATAANQNTNRLADENNALRQRVKDLERNIKQKENVTTPGN